mmetsp:Transcript_105467/g.308356  ORF Transcript_105467/g.308356 Transcript_105467/m.308356 type:complete len:274 (-) Transcript_105467:260-1081(-)
MTQHDLSVAWASLNGFHHKHGPLLWVTGCTWSTMLLKMVSICAPARKGQMLLEHCGRSFQLEVLVLALRALPPTSPAAVAAVCRDWYDLLKLVVGHPPWPVRIWDLGHSSVYMMGFRMRGLAAVAGRGRMTFRTDDFPTGLDVHAASSYSIEWTKRSGEGEPWQWCGWHQGRVPEGRWIRVSVWIKFVERVPARSADFGIKVQSVVHNDWVNGLGPDKWHYVCVDAKTVLDAASDEILLTFNSVSGPQTVRFAGLVVQVFNLQPGPPELAAGP